ncbi:MAG: hypothetical protein MUQ27_14750, partial [Acidimicrobiia bacterium]|nr:hypothetical protein [Acidimicrobiia bacterium]
MARRTMILMVVFALATSACGGGDDAGDTGATVATGDGMVGLLATLPDTADNRHQIILNDFAAIGEILGIDSPGRNATPDELIEYVITLTIGDISDPRAAADL